MALLFVTLPFVVRSVQPVLLELDRSMEEAAASLGAGRLTVFRRIVLPEPDARDHLRRGAQLRAGGRRVRIGGADLGQPAVQDGGGIGLHLQPDPERKPAGGRGGVGRCSGRARGAGRCRAESRMSSGGAARCAPAPRGADARRAPLERSRACASRLLARVLALGYLALLLLLPVAMIFYRTFEHGLGAVWSAVDRTQRRARVSGCRSSWWRSRCR